MYPGWFSCGNGNWIELAQYFLFCGLILS